VANTEAPRLAEGIRRPCSGALVRSEDMAQQRTMSSVGRRACSGARGNGVQRRAGGRRAAAATTNNQHDGL
jgi:hypothetical protein